VKPCSPPKKVSLDTNAPATPQKSKLADEFVSFLKIVAPCSSCLEILSLHARNEGDQKPEDAAEKDIDDRVSRSEAPQPEEAQTERNLRTHHPFLDLNRGRDR
jgi:hypothetical protein